jgi:hypothetical protein
MEDKKKIFFQVFLLWLKGTNLLSSRGQAIFPFYREYLSSVAGKGLTFSVCREYFWCVADVWAFLVCCGQWGCLFLSIQSIFVVLQVKGLTFFSL